MPAKKTKKIFQASQDSISIKGARQHNLKNLDLKIPLGKLTVITGPSGSGKSSLAFHTLYAEGQRRYVETFSPYVRQFLDRMDKPAVDRIDGIPPAIAIEQKNSIRSTRSTVGTLTELNDYLKLLFPHLATAYDPSTGEKIKPDTTESISGWCHKNLSDKQILVLFPITTPTKTPTSEILSTLNAQGYTRIHHAGKIIRTDDPHLLDLWAANPPESILVVQDRLKLTTRNRNRLLEAINTALTLGKGSTQIISDDQQKSFTTTWTNPSTGFTLRQPTPALFSFNSPLGACPHCRGFGRTIGIDLSKAIPDPSLSIKQGCVTPFTTAKGSDCQQDLLRAAKSSGINVNTPFHDLTDQERQWLLYGERDSSQDAWENGEWYGVKGFFDWCETKAYKMHVRVFLSRYRAYTNCPHCHGTRLQPEALCFKIHGKTLPDLWHMPINELSDWFTSNLKLTTSNSLKHALTEITSRLRYLCQVGLTYLTLDRPANTLSGGEIERVNLTTCLGAALTNTLFVLDEPTVGLHQRDIQQLVSIMQDLRDKGNTVVVVEHEETVMRACDHLIDLGPAAGEHGGSITYQGPAYPITQATPNTQHSATLSYLTGRKKITVPTTRRDSKHHLHITGASKHNIKDLTLDLPLGIFTCLTGVSGSGKSTLAHDILYLNLAKQLGISNSAEVASIKKLTGAQHLTSVEQVDQSPLTRTPRSTPAVHTGAFEMIRQLYAQTPSATAQNLTPGYFSFNAGDGRCQRCLGNGFEKVEMQFLSDLFITCPECDGKRYTQHALDFKYHNRNISETLSLTISEAVQWTSSPPEKTTKREQNLLKKIANSLQPLIDVGLGYLRLGQPLNTLSGGESQRLKLSRLLTTNNHAADSSRLLILDEPTTGLHFTDIENLLNVFHRLTDAGHSLLVIEHNLDVIRSADHIIDLGPGPGINGGKIIFTGTPEQILTKKTETAKALLPRKTNRKKPPKNIVKNNNLIEVSGAREHNLKNISVNIPRDELVVVTGLSGSGKSTLAFDLIFAEGQRRFLDSMSPYARQFAGQLEKPDVDRIIGLPPTVAIEQRVSRGGGKSTTGTVTEIYHFLRLLYAKLGIQHCPESGEAVISQTPEAIDLQIKKLRKKHKNLILLAPLVHARKGFHTDIAAAAARQGIKQLLVDGSLTESENFQPLARFKPHDIFALCEDTQQALTLGNGHCATLTKHPNGNLETYSIHRVSPVTGKSFDHPDPHHFSFNSHRGWCPACRGYGGVTAASSRQAKPNKYNSTLEAEIHETLTASDSSTRVLCPECHGARLREESRHVFIHNQPIQTINNLSVINAIKLLEKWKFSGRDQLIARDILPEIIQRLHFLHHVGLGYLQLSRSADTLSGGESQRIRLAAQLGSSLRGVLYVLDEPTIGLHPRDNVKLLNTLEALRDRGNSLLVVEHDDETISRASTVIELGPGAGALGGEIIHRRIATPVITKTNYPRRTIPKATSKTGWLKLRECHTNNLKNIDVRIPLARLTVLTGVSGCGKSSLMRGCISVAAAPTRKANKPYKSAAGFNNIKHCFEVDQTPIGKTSRSCPATYVKLFDTIRQLFAQLPEARTRGFTASQFSFNNAVGQCPECKGNGRIKLEMDFLPTTWVHCEACQEMRYNPATLEVRYNGKNIGDVLRMSIRQATEFFSAHPKLHRTLQLLNDTGLGYLQLGQPSPTLSGGEAQRIKLVSELTKGRKSITKGALQKNNLYLIEEPSIGLHQQDVEKLIIVIHRLVEEGHTVIVIEHHTAVMAEADYIIDIGPEAGEQGGKIITQGTPEHIIKSKTSRTAPFLKEHLYPKIKI